MRKLVLVAALLAATPAFAVEDLGGFGPNVTNEDIMDQLQSMQDDAVTRDLERRIPYNRNKLPPPRDTRRDCFMHAVFGLACWN
jgi:hypothetical protein